MKSDALLIFCGGLLYGYDVGIISGAIDSIPYAINRQQKEHLVSIVLIGQLLSSLLIGKISKYFNSFQIIPVALASYSACLIGFLSADNMVCGLFFRTVLGFFISLNMIKTTSFIAETVSDDSRGFYLSLNEAGVTFGILASFVTSAVFGSNWKILFLFMLPVSFVAMSALFFKFKNHEAKSKKYSAINFNLRNDTSKIRSKNPPKYASKSTAHPTPFPKYEFTMCMFLVVATQASGQPTFLYYAKSAFPDNSTIITFGVVKFLSTLFCSGLVDKLGRKTMLTTGCLVMTASLFCIGSFSDRFWSSFLMQFSFGAYAFGFSISFGACLFIVLNELFDDFWRQRLIGYSIARVNNTFSVIN